MVMDAQGDGVSAEHHRVLGQLVLALRESGLLVGAREVDYQVRDGGIVVEWIAGAYAHEVADGLAAYGAAGWLDINAIAPVPSPRPQACLIIGGLAVTFAAYQPVGLAHARATARPRFRRPIRSGPTRCCAKVPARTRSTGCTTRGRGGSPRC